MKRLWSTISLVALAVVALSPTLPAQNTNSTDIRGVATDSTGAVVPDVIVTVLDIEKGVAREFKTNASGLYDTGPIVTGTYKITLPRRASAHMCAPRSR
jgi:hypothetical protein